METIEWTNGLFAMGLFTAGVVVGWSFRSLAHDVRQWEADNRRIRRQDAARERKEQEGKQ